MSFARALTAIRSISPAHAGVIVGLCAMGACGGDGPDPTGAGGATTSTGAVGGASAVATVASVGPGTSGSGGEGGGSSPIEAQEELGQVLVADDPAGGTRIARVHFDSIEPARGLCPKGHRVMHGAVSGPCIAFSCEPDPDDGPSLDAGSISVVTPHKSFVIQFDGGEYVAPNFEAGTFFEPGKLVTISAAGAELPPFEVTVDSPNLVEFARPEGPNPVIDREEGHHISWSGVGGPLVRVVIAKLSDAPRGAYCETTASDGGFTATPVVLEHLPPGEVFVLTGVRDARVVELGATRVRVAAHRLGPTWQAEAR